MEKSLCRSLPAILEGLAQASAGGGGSHLEAASGPAPVQVPGDPGDRVLDSGFGLPLLQAECPRAPFFPKGLEDSLALRPGLILEASRLCSWTVRPSRHHSGGQSVP